MERVQLTEQQITKAFGDIGDKLNKTLDKKGYGTFASRHEILGVITEEYREFADAVHGKNYDEMRNELIDLAVACHFALACFNEKTIEW